MQKIMLLGKDGMLGKALKKELSSEFELHAFDLEDFDVRNFEEVEKRVKEISPSVIVNASAYTNVDEAENERDIAMEVNAKSVGNLAKLCEEMDVRLIHFSTDYVFDGESKEGYRENSIPNPINFYGKTKLEGEKAILASGCEFALIRLSWLFGEGKNFVNTMLALGRDNKEVKVVEDQKGKPTYAKDLAKRVVGIIKDDESGIFHLPNEGETSWSEFAKKIFEIAKMDVKVIPIKSDEWKTLAKRPKNSSLLNTKLPKMRNWEEALRDFLQTKNIV